MDVSAKAIVAVMNTTWEVVKIRPEKKILEFFFHFYSSSSAHHCEDRFHIYVFIRSHMYDFHIFTIIHS